LRLVEKAAEGVDVSAEREAFLESKWRGKLTSTLITIEITDSIPAAPK